MYKQLVCLVLGTLAVGSQAFMPAAPLVKASASAAARVIQPAVPETGACHCTGCVMVVVACHVVPGMGYGGLGGGQALDRWTTDRMKMVRRHRGWTRAMHT